MAKEVGHPITQKYLAAQLALKGNLASPAFTGNPTAPTQTAGNTSTRLATTAFVTAAFAAKFVAAPAAANSTGVAGTYAYASGFFYVCVATNTWQRVAIAAW